MGSCPVSSPWLGAGSHRQSLVNVIRKLWEQHADNEDLQIPRDCGVRGLFDLAPGEAAEAGVVEGLRRAAT